MSTLSCRTTYGHNFTCSKANIRPPHLIKIVKTSFFTVEYQTHFKKKTIANLEQKSYKIKLGKWVPKN